MQILRLANEDQSILIDLSGGPIIRLGEPGFDLETPGMGGAFTYEPYGAQFDFENFQPHTETFSLTLRGLAGAVVNQLDRLQDFLEAVRLFNAGDIAAKSCWLEFSADGEELKRSLLYAASFQVTSRDNITPGEPCLMVGTLALTRHPLWETPTTSYITASSKSTLGGQYNYTDIPGNTLARIWQGTATPSGMAILYRYWVGIRRFNQGVSGFEPLWECEDGTNVAADTSDVNLVGVASADWTVRTTFAVGGLVERFNISVDDVWTAAANTDYNHVQGRYLVLMRCRVIGVGAVAGIQMHSGYTGNIIHEEIYIDNTNWRLIPLGNISIPPWEGHYFRGDGFVRNFTLNIYAEEITAPCDLDCDCLVLIPNEHMLYGEGSELNVFTMEDDRSAGYAPDAFGLASDAIYYSLTDWYLPPGDGMIIVAAEDTAAHALGENMTSRLDYYPRWTLYRGE